jgi:putative addiction module killer protein
MNEEQFDEWLDDLKDPMTRARVRTRLDRVVTGNFGDSKTVGDGVFELRFTFGSAFRVYAKVLFTQQAQLSKSGICLKISPFRIL